MGVTYQETDDKLGVKIINIPKIFNCLLLIFQILNQELCVLKNRVFDVKEELFVKNMKIRDLEKMEEVAEIAVNRCRKRLVYLQNRVEKRKEMLEKVNH